MYRTDNEEVSAARLERRRLFEAMTPEEQVFIYEAFEATEKRLAQGTMERTTAQITAMKGTEYRNGGADESDEVEKVEKENEGNLCSNEKCTAGDDHKRKKLALHVEIIQAGDARYCSKLCQAQGSLR
jgi:hypothetical protein